MKLCIAIVFMFMICGTSYWTSSAQTPTAGPTLAETSKFILGKLYEKQFHYYAESRNVTLRNLCVCS